MIISIIDGQKVFTNSVRQADEVRRAWAAYPQILKRNCGDRLALNQQSFAGHGQIVLISGKDQGVGMKKGDVFITSGCF